MKEELCVRTQGCAGLLNMCYTQHDRLGEIIKKLTCESFDAWALKEPSRAVVIVQLLVEQLKARVDAAVLLCDISIVEVRGGGHGCWRGRGRGATRPQSKVERG